MLGGRVTNVALCLALAGTGACALDNPGVEAPAATLNYPIAVALSRAAPGTPSGHLFVASSNFDLRYNAGSVLSFDLDRLEAALAACTEADRSHCSVPTPADVLAPHGEVRTGSYAAGMALGPGGRRLYLPVRGDGELTFVDVDDAGGLSCGGQGATPRCDDFHSRGNDSVANDRGIALPAEPVGIAAGDVTTALGGPEGAGDFVAIADRSGRLSLYLEQVSPDAMRAPLLVHVGGGLPESITSLAVDARTKLMYLGVVGSAELARAGVALDTRTGMLERSFVFSAGSLRLAGLDDGADTRALAFEPPPDGAGEAPHRVYLASRRPEALIVVDLDASGATPTDASIVRVVEVGAGPARVTTARLGGRTYVFVSCFDGRELYVVDADQGEVVSVVGGLSGPFELAVDPVRGRAYVGDFRSSVVRVVDVSGLADGVPARLVGTLGKPRSAESLQ